MKHLLLNISLFMMATFNLFAADGDEIKVKAPRDIQKIYQALMIGTLDNDIDKFHSVCDAGMKSAITKLKLASVNETIGKLITKESMGEYIGYYLKDGVEIHLYKLVQKTSSDDLVVFLSVKDDKCVGLLFQ